MFLIKTLLLFESLFTLAMKKGEPSVISLSLIRLADLLILNSSVTATGHFICLRDKTPPAVFFQG